MDYEEFKWALGDSVSIPLLAQCFNERKSLGDTANRTLMRDFRLYMLVGGMPHRTKRAIISLYEKDFNRIDPTGNASKLFHQIPAELNRNASRYLTWSATDGVRNDTLSEIVFEMKESMVVNIAHHANDPSAGMALHQNTERYKMFVGDTGLFVTFAFLGQEVHGQHNL